MNTFDYYYELLSNVLHCESCREGIAEMVSPFDPGVWLCRECWEEEMEK